MTPQHDDVDYTPSPSMNMVIEMLEFAANHDGELDPYHQALSEQGRDGLDEEVLAIFENPYLLERGPDDDGIYASAASA